MADYKYENGKYYRKSTKGDYYEVQRNKEGHPTWTQPNGVKVYDDKTILHPYVGEVSTPIGTEYVVPAGSNGSIRRYYSFDDAVNAYDEAKDSGAFADSSENILNDALIGTYTPKLAWSAGKGVVSTVRSALNKPIKELIKSGIKATPRVAAEAGLGYAGSVGVDKVTEHFTGNSWADNVSKGLSQHWGFKVPSMVGEFTNPGYVVSPYSAFVFNNYRNLGRYTLDNLRPAGYTGYLDAAKGWVQALYKKPPSFFKHRPKWYEKDDVFHRARFENGANWANISEDEIPRYLFTTRRDGIVEPKFLEERGLKTTNYPSKLEGMSTDADFLTPGQVGGEHSDFFYLGEDALGNQGILFQDVQKLNPQWELSDKIKRAIGNSNNPIYKIADKLGGYNLSWLLGYKPFTIGAGIKISPNGTASQIPLDELKKTFMK